MPSILSGPASAVDRAHPGGVGEMIGANVGIGSFLLTTGNLMQTDQLMAGIVAIAVLGLLIGALISWLERVLRDGGEELPAGEKPSPQCYDFAPDSQKVGGTHDHAAPGRACHVRDADLDKALAYYTEVNGLVLNSRDKPAPIWPQDRLLTIALERGAMRAAADLLRGLAQGGRRDMARKLAADGIRARYAATRFGHRKCWPQRPQGHTIELFQEWKISRRPPPVFSRRPAQARAHRLCGGGPAGDRGFHCACWASGVRLDRGILRLPALQPRHHTVNFHPRPKPKMHHIAFEMRIRPYAARLRAPGVRKIPINWGAVATWLATTSRSITAISTTRM